MTEKKSGSGTTRMFIKDNYIPKVEGPRIVVQKNYTPGTTKPDANHTPTTNQSPPPTPPPAPKKK